MVRTRNLLLITLVAVLCLCTALTFVNFTQVQAEANPYCNLPLAVVTFSGGGVASGGEYLTNGEIANPNYCYVVSGTTTKQLYIRYAGSSECTFYVVLRNYSFTAGAWQGAVKIVSNVPIHIVMFVEGQNKILGYNHSGISADGTMNYDIVFSTVNEGTLEVGSQYSDVKALQGTNYTFDYNACCVSYISNPSISYPTNNESEYAVKNACNVTNFKFTLKTPSCLHNFVRTVTKEPTCTETGEARLVCTSCGAVKTETETISALGHEEYKRTVTKEPTCTEEGVATLVCPRCHDTKTEAIDPLGHNPSTEWTIDKESTYWEEGSRSQHCTHCDEKLNVTPIPMKICEHNYVRTVTTEPTCTEEGVATLVCPRCHDTKTEAIDPLGHNPSSEWTVDKEPTYWEEGSKSQHCTRCDEKLNVTPIPMKICEHNYVRTVTKEPTCTEEGVATLVCSVCGDIKTEAIEPLGHEEYVRTVTKEPTCTEKGEATLVCPRCHDTKTEAIEPLGHDVSDEWTIDVRPTFDDVGSKSHHCNRCDEKFDVTEIAKLERTIEKEDVKELIVISEESTETVEEAIATIEQETLVDIVETVNVELNDLEKQLSSGAITQEVYEERVEIVTAVTESAIIVGSQMAQAEEKGEEVLSVLPQNIDLDLGGYFNDFYARQMSLLLGKGESPVANARKIVASVGGIGSRTVYRDAEAPSSQGIDYGISAETYRGVVEFVDSSVDKMTNAALMIRNCSGEHLKKSVKDYIEKVSVSSFRDFDKEAANEEFVENAYQAILLNMQQQVLASLQQAYEDGKKGVSFGSNPAVDEAYQNQVEAVSDIEQFEIMVTEILRQKYNSLPQVTEPIEDVDEFYPVYRSIFRKWALNEEGEVDITLEQLTNATISEVNHKGTHIDINTTLTADEVATLVIFGVAVVAVAGAYIVFTMIKKEGDAE